MPAIEHLVVPVAHCGQHGKEVQTQKQERRLHSCSSTPISTSRDFTPAAFTEVIAIVPVFPARSDPHSMRAWRRLPTTCLPGIGMAVPTVISANPYVIPAGQYSGSGLMALGGATLTTTSTAWRRCRGQAPTRSLTKVYSRAARYGMPVQARGPFNVRS